MSTKPYLYSDDLITWVSVDGDEATIGFTEYACERMEELMAVELKEAGDEITQGGPCGSADLAKTVQDIPSPISGIILANNAKAIETPDVILEDSYGQGWLLKVRITNPAELDSLLSAQEYQARTATE